VKIKAHGFNDHVTVAHGAINFNHKQLLLLDHYTTLSNVVMVPHIFGIIISKLTVFTYKSFKLSFLAPRVLENLLTPDLWYPKVNYCAQNSQIDGNVTLRK
jgi:hypothetical protein